MLSQELHEPVHEPLHEHMSPTYFCYKYSLAIPIPCAYVHLLVVLQPCKRGVFQMRQYFKLDVVITVQDGTALLQDTSWMTLHEVAALASSS